MSVLVLLLHRVTSILGRRRNTFFFYFYRDLEGARNILEIMQKNDCPPSANTYGVLLEGYAENGDLEGMEKLLKDCNEKELVLSSQSVLKTICNLVSNDCYQDGAVKEVWIVFFNQMILLGGF